MKTLVAIIGVGLGPDTLTHQASVAIAGAEVLIGSPRLVAQFAKPDQTTRTATRPADIVDAVQALPAGRVVILMSGDVGFHSGATKVYAGLSAMPERFKIRLIPGLSTPQCFAARLGVPWDQTHLISCHITSSAIVAAVRRHRFVMALTGGNVPAIANQLIEAGFGELTVQVGENLGRTASDTKDDAVDQAEAAPMATPDEHVTRTTIAQLQDHPWSSLTILMIDNPHPDARCRSGIPDDEFARGQVPMTKQAIRAQALARLDIAPTDVCWDVGCGTGSVTVELALAAYEGMVWGVDKNPEAIELTRGNAQAFHIGNIRAVEGAAPAAMAEWPAPDAVFIGGSSGSLAEIVDVALNRNPDARILVTAIAIESAAAAITVLTSHGITPQITQISATHGRAAGGLHLLMAQNPVTLVSGRRHD